MHVYDANNVQTKGGHIWPILFWKLSEHSFPVQSNSDAKKATQKRQTQVTEIIDNLAKYFDLLISNYSFMWNFTTDVPVSVTLAVFILIYLTEPNILI